MKRNKLNLNLYLLFPDEILIELVKGKRGLYDLQSHYYSDKNYKRKMWNEIEEAVGLPGK